MSDYNLGFPEIAELTDALLKVSAFASENTRRQMLLQLPFAVSIDDADNSRGHALAVLTEAIRWPRGIEALVDALCLVDGGSNSLLKLLDLLGSCIPLAVSWTHMQELRRIVRLAQVTDDAARLAFRRVSGSGASVPREWPQKQIFLYSLDHYAATPVTEAPDLFRFLILCLPAMRPEIQPRVRAWIEERCTEMSIDVGKVHQSIQDNPMVEPDAHGAEPVALVRVKPLSLGAYKIDGWLFQGPEPQKREHIRLPQSVTDAEFGEERVAAMIHIVAQYALDQILDPPEILSVEAVLPATLLFQDLDSKRVRDDETEPPPSFAADKTHAGLGDNDLPLRVRYRLVVRSYERLYSPTHWRNRGSWKARWQQCIPLDRKLRKDDVCSVKSVDDYGDWLYSDLALGRVMLLGVVPPGDTPESCSELLIAALRTGTPLALWLRKPAEDPVKAEAVLTTIICEARLGSLPGRLRDNRLQRAAFLAQSAKNTAPAQDPKAAPHACWEHATLLWDSFARLPADKDSA